MFILCFVVMFPPPLNVSWVVWEMARLHLRIPTNWQARINYQLHICSYISYAHTYTCTCTCIGISFDADYRSVISSHRSFSHGRFPHLSKWMSERARAGNKLWQTKRLLWHYGNTVSICQKQRRRRRKMEKTETTTPIKFISFYNQDQKWAPSRWST